MALPWFILYYRDTQTSEPVGHMTKMALGRGPADKMTTLTLTSHFHFLYSAAVLPTWMIIRSSNSNISQDTMIKIIIILIR